MRIKLLVLIALLLIPVVTHAEVNVGGAWGFWGDSQTAGRAPVESGATSTPEAIINIASVTPTTTRANGVSGRPLALSHAEYDTYGSKAGLTWVHFQESGDQDEDGQRTAADFGVTFEAAMANIHSDSPNAVISYETAYSFGREAEQYRDWTTYNTQLKTSIANLAASGITVVLCDVDTKIKALIAHADIEPGEVWYQSGEDNAFHYTALGNLMVALTVWTSMGYDVSTFDFSDVSDISAGDIAIAISIATASTTTPITTVSLHDKSSSSVRDYPLTFGIVLKHGDATGNVYLNNGTDIPTQTNVKTTWPDGSIRHCVISAIIPSISANGSTELKLNTTGIGAVTTPINKTAMLATDIGATIDLSSLSGSGHSGTLQANLRNTLTAATLDYWLSGSICSEIILKQTLSNSLDVEWEVRFYPTGDIRITHVINNINANYRGDVNYALSISHGNASPAVVDTDPLFKHNAMARLRKQLWLTTEPPEVEIHYDTDYLISTGHITSYDTSITPPESTISGLYAEWNTRNTAFDVGIGMWDSGAFDNNDNSEASPLMQWDVLYLLTWDNRLREIMTGMSDVMGSCDVHWREYDVAMDFYGHTVSIDDRPNMRTRDATGFPAEIDTNSSQWGFDLAHQWEFNYLPYVLTGEKWYIDELYYWSGFNLGYPNPAYRDYSEGIIPFAEQVRGVGWTYRTLSRTAAMAPDDSIEKAYFTDKVQNNLTFYTNLSTNSGPLYAMSDENEAIDEGFTAEATAGTSGWMHDFMLLGFNVGHDLGFDATDMFTTYSQFVINRFHHPDFNWYNGAEYRFPTATAEGSVTSWAQASSLYASQPTAFEPVGYAYDYRHKAMAALSQVVEYTNGQAAYNWLLANFTAGIPDLETQFADDPTWAIIPRANSDGYDSPTISGPADFSTTESSVEIEGTYTVDPELPDQAVIVTWTLGEDSGFAVAALGVFSCTVPDLALGTNSIVFEITDSESATANDTTIVTRLGVKTSKINGSAVLKGAVIHQ